MARAWLRLAEQADKNNETIVEQILINLITGALGGVGAGKASPTFDLGTIGNIISGLVGGGVLTAITRHAQRQCREPSSGRRMTVSLQPVH